MMSKGRSTSEMEAIPEELQWERAERALRQHFAAAGRSILDVSPEPLETLGTVFWVRYREGLGGLALVRGDQVFAAAVEESRSAASGEAMLTALLSHDQLLERRQISPPDFLYLLQQLRCLPELPADPFESHRLATLNPRWEFGNGRARFILHAPRARSGPRHGAERHEVVDAVRATLHLDPSYALTWKLEDVQVESDSEQE
jgi:hypothetical protein